MPLPERLIQPVSLSRGTLSCPVPDELEGVTNGTLANIIRQLSTLSRHAEEMFGNLFQEAEGLANRSGSLQARIDRLAVQVTQLDSTVEEVSLQDIHLRKAFRSTQNFDQQVVSRDTMPKAMMEVYMACDKPPPLNKLNPYREDGKDGLKFYTDPNYFFELWRQEMLKDTERVMQGKKPGKSNSAGNGNGSGQKSERSKKRVRQPNSTMEKQRQKAVGQGEYIMRSEYDPHQPYPPPHEMMGQMDLNASGGSGIVGYDPALADGPPGQQQQQARPNSIEIKRSYQGGFQYNSQQEDIYMPRILRNDQPPSPQQHQQQQQGYMPQQQQQPQSYQQFTHPSNMEIQQPGMIQQQQDYSNRGGYQPYGGQQASESPSSMMPGTPTRRPNEPPPAPPPNELGTPTRGNRDSLPPPPPPPAATDHLVKTNGGSPSMQNATQLPPPHHASPMHQQLMSQLNSHHLVSNGVPPNAGGGDLPPPPPVPENGGAANGLLDARVPAGHMAPSPPPPPPVTSTATPPTSNGLPPSVGVAGAVAQTAAAMGAAPPPPPPPPPGPLINGGFKNGITKGSSPVKSSSSSPPKSLLSPQGLKKPAQKKHSVQDGVRSDLLKAIRDGIALRKVEETAAAAKAADEKKEPQADVASILARRVAVEMSDSDNEHGGGGQSDSEYDSDDWGDESQA